MLDQDHGQVKFPHEISKNKLGSLNKLPTIANLSPPLRADTDKCRDALREICSAPADQHPARCPGSAEHTACTVRMCFA